VTVKSTDSRFMGEKEKNPMKTKVYYVSEQEDEERQ
jgi:hypothetical protein